MRIVITLVFTGFCLFLASQTKPPTYKTYFEEGSYLLVEDDPDGALKNFEIAYQMDSSSANINYMLGICYLQSSMKKYKAEYHLAKAVQQISNTYKSDLASETSAPPLAHFFYGEALEVNYKFDEALKQFGEFNKYVDPKDVEYLKMLEKEEATTSLAKTMVANPINVMITNLGDSVNSEFPEYSPVLSADEKTLIFTTRRPNSTGGQKTPNGQYFEDIVVCYKDENEKWSKPIPLSQNVNSMGHEASINLSSDGQTLIVFKDNNGNGDIYYTNYDGKEWSTLKDFGSNVNTEFWESHACLNGDGTVLFFASNRPGGLGGKDIYRCVKLPNGQWSMALNMGPNINSEYDEDGAFIHPDGQTFFFSTNGYKTMGGYDIMYATLNEDNKFSNVTNIGYPINTTDDDIFYVTSPDGKRGYFSSAKQDGGYGEKDIYRITIAEAKEKFLALFKGQLIPAEGESLPDHISIIVRDKETNEIVGNYRPRIVNGSFSTILPPGKEYNFSYRTEDGEEFYNEDVSVQRDQSYQEIKREVNLEPVKLVGKIKVKQNTIVLNTKVLHSRKNKKIVPKARITLECAGLENQSFESDSMGIYNGVVLDFDKKYILYAELGTKTASVEINTAGVKTAKIINQSLYLYGKSEKFTSKELMLDVVVKNTATKLGVPDAQVILTSSYGEKTELKTDLAGVIRNVPLSPEMRYSLVANKNNFSSEKTTFTTGIVQEGNRYTQEILISIDEPALTNTDCPTADTEYEIYFKYNRNKKDTSDACWDNFITRVVAQSKNGIVRIMINASASKVPTRSFRSNKDLAFSRASRLKRDVIADVGHKGGDVSKLKFTSSAVVGGPNYIGDWLIGRKKYEAHQYSKAKIK